MFFFTEQSPERTVSLAETKTPDLQLSDNSSECPDELYNLTKLAEVSLAAAAGQILDHPHLSTNSSNCSNNNNNNNDTSNNNNNQDEEFPYTYTHKLFDKSSRAMRPHLIKVKNTLNCFSLLIIINIVLLLEWRFPKIAKRKFQQ